MLKNIQSLRNCGVFFIITLLFALASCSSGKILVFSEIARAEAGDDSRLKSLQFLSGRVKIRYERMDWNVKSGVAPDHKLTVHRHDERHAIVIKSYTPGILFSVGPNHLIIDYGKGIRLRYEETKCRSFTHTSRIHGSCWSDQHGKKQCAPDTTFEWDSYECPDSTGHLTLYVLASKKIIVDGQTFHLEPTRKPSILMFRREEKRTRKETERSAPGMRLPD